DTETLLVLTCIPALSGTQGQRLQPSWDHHLVGVRCRLFGRVGPEPSLVPPYLVLRRDRVFHSLRLHIRYKMSGLTALCAHLTVAGRLLLPTNCGTLRDRSNP